MAGTQIGSVYVLKVFATFFQRVYSVCILQTKTIRNGNKTAANQRQKRKQSNREESSFFIHFMQKKIQAHQSAKKKLKKV